MIYDNQREGLNPRNSILFPNLTNIESASTDHLDFLSNGFKMKSLNNNTDHSFIFWAFAEQPFKYANAK